MTLETAILFARHAQTKTEIEEVKEFYHTAEEALLHQQERENAQPLTLEELKPCEKHEFGLVHDCSECMNGAPYTFCCQIECGEHEFCRGCKFPKR